jgi:hypothetical protein
MYIVESVRSQPSTHLVVSDRRAQLSSYPCRWKVPRLGPSLPGRLLRILVHPHHLGPDQSAELQSADRAHPTGRAACVRGVSSLWWCRNSRSSSGGQGDPPCPRMLQISESAGVERRLHEYILIRFTQSLGWTASAHPPLGVPWH